MKSTFLMALLGLAGFASASFDLILVGDNTGNTTGPVMNRIHRYDGDSGTYLGSFSTGTTAMSSMAADYANSRVYVTQGLRVFGYNYNSGSLEFGSNNIGFINSLKMYNGQLYAVTSNTIFSVNTISGAFSAVITNPFSGAFRDIAFSSSGNAVVLDAGGGRLLGYNSALSFVTSTAISSVGAVSSIIAEGGSSNGFVALYSNATTPTIMTQSRFTYSGAFGTQSQANYSTIFSNNFSDAENSHDGHWSLARNNTGQLSLFSRSRFDSPINIFGAPQVTTPSGHMAVVLAPEPGTFAAMGLGLAAIGRYRRRKR